MAVRQRSTIEPTTIKNAQKCNNPTTNFTQDTEQKQKRTTFPWFEWNLNAKTQKTPYTTMLFLADFCQPN